MVQEELQKDVYKTGGITGAMRNNGNFGFLNADFGFFKTVKGLRLTSQSHDKNRAP